jgi:hypothetical protein
MVLVDGHNRFEICRQHDIRLNYCLLNDAEIKTLTDVERWIINNQLSRRNLTDAQREEFIGKLYNAEKKAVGNPDMKSAKKGQNDANLQCGRNVHIANLTKSAGQKQVKSPLAGKKMLVPNEGEHAITEVDLAGMLRTSEKVAKEQGVSVKTVQRAAKFADAVGRIEKISPEAASKIRNEKSVLPRGEVRALADAPEEAVKQAAKAIIEDKPIAPKPKPPAPKPAPVAGAPAPTVRASNEAPKSEVPKFQTLDGQIFRMVEEIKNRLEVLDGLLPRRGELRGECMESVPKIMKSLQHDANNTFRRWMGDSSITTVIDHVASCCDYLEKLVGESWAEKLTDQDIEEIIVGTKSNLTALNVLLRYAVMARDKRGGGKNGSNKYVEV